MKILFIVLMVLLFGCDVPLMVVQASTGHAPVGRGTTSVSDSREDAASTDEALLLFGGKGHKVFLGCLNCSEYDSVSVSNKYGKFGSEYNTDSIFNQYGQYGSPYSNYSPCNEYASEPPVVVDKRGKFYGRLTENQFKNPVNGIWKAWLAGVCSH